VVAGRVKPPMFFMAVYAKKMPLLVEGKPGRNWKLLNSSYNYAEPVAICTLIEQSRK
jgi:hypothetical protein